VRDPLAVCGGARTASDPLYELFGRLNRVLVIGGAMLVDLQIDRHGFSVPFKLNLFQKTFFSREYS
jgi:hypothetical protein